MSRFKLFGPALVALLAILGPAVPAQAAFRIRVENLDTGNGIVITDNALGDQSNKQNRIALMTDFDQFDLVITAGLATPTSLEPGLPTIAGVSDGIKVTISVSANAAGNLRIILEKDGFDVAPDGVPLTLVSLFSGVNAGPAGSTLTVQSWAKDYDDGNPADVHMPDLGPDTGGSLMALAAVTDLPPAGSVAVYGPGGLSSGSGLGNADNSQVQFTKQGQYSLFSSATLSFTGAGAMSLDHVTATNPAPAGLLLLVSGAPVLAVGAWLRRRNVCVPQA